MVREANINDVEAIVDIIYQAWQQAFTGIIDPAIPETLSRDKYRVIFTDIINQKLEKTFVFESYDRVAGYISGKVQHELYDAEVLGLYVHPDYQNRHIGSQLLATLKTYFIHNNCNNMIIWTLLDAKNNEFYKRQGSEQQYYKRIAIRGNEYPAVGFFFDLSK